jgi:hypothetical protein
MPTFRRPARTPGERAAIDAAFAEYHKAKRAGGNRDEADRLRVLFLRAVDGAELHYIDAAAVAAWRPVAWRLRLPIGLPPELGPAATILALQGREPAVRWLMGREHYADERLAALRAWHEKWAHSVSFPSAGPGLPRAAARAVVAALAEHIVPQRVRLKADLLDFSIETDRAVSWLADYCTLRRSAADIALEADKTQRTVLRRLHHAARVLGLVLCPTRGRPPNSE